MLNITNRLFKSLELAGVEYCNWKSNQHLFAAVSGKTDLDILVSGSQSQQCEQVLINNHFKQCNAQAWNGYPGIEDWLGFDADTGSLIHVHLHYQLLVGQKFIKEIHLPWEDLILSTAVRHSEYALYVTKPELELLLLLIRIALKTNGRPIPQRESGCLPKNIKDEYEYLVQQIDLTEFGKWVDDLIGSQASKTFHRLVEYDCLDSPVGIKRLKTELTDFFGTNRRSSRLSMFVQKYTRLFIYLHARTLIKLGARVTSKKLLKDGGSIIAIIGCDGAGKTTIANTLVAWLGWKLDTHLFYFGQDSLIRTIFIRLAVFRRRFRKNMDATERASVTKDGRQKTSKTKGKLSTSIVELSVSEARVKKLLCARRLRQAGGVVITDRFPQTQFVGIYDGPRFDSVESSGWLSAEIHTREQRNYAIIAGTPPDVVVKLLLPVEEACRRKPDHRRDVIEQKTAITEQLEFDSSLTLEFDATKPLDDLILDIKRKLWEVI